MERVDRSLVRGTEGDVRADRGCGGLLERERLRAGRAVAERGRAVVDDLVPEWLQGGGVERPARLEVADGKLDVVDLSGQRRNGCTVTTSVPLHSRVSAMRLAPNRPFGG